MTNVAPVSSRRHAGGELAVGVAAGILLGLLTSLIPIVTVIGVGILLVATLLGIARRRARLATLAGATLGSGLVLLWGLYVTVQSCLQTSNVCGDANITPLLVFAGAATATGALGSILTLGRS